ncbi:hypothetical protein F5X98DRAFT_381865 [Xylaria grammica]|nr:hypothetical protein F5X98DRAFT_381865 [Xylaria grammica]
MPWEAIGTWKGVPRREWFNTYALTLQIRLGTETMQVDASFDGRVIKVPEIQAITSQELNQMWEWNSIVLAPAGHCARHVIRDVVESQPDALAVEAWDGHLTYRELEALSGGISLVTSSPKNISIVSPRTNKVVEVGPGSIGAFNLATVNASTDPPQPFSTAMFAVFTSGRTGIPKGVVMAHENFDSGLKYQSELLRFARDSRVFDFAAYSFNIAVHNGNLIKALIDTKATIVDLTPSVARLLDPSTLPNLRTPILAKKAVTAQDVAQWLGKLRLVDAYGPAECGISTISVGTQISEPKEATSIGRGADLVTWAVDQKYHNHLLPPGCIVELLLEGPLVGRGYLSDAQRTAAAFIHDTPWLLRGAPKHPGRSGRL